MERPKYLNSFGRRQVRGLRGNQSGRMKELLPKVELALPENGEVKLPGKEHWLEIGYGAGEHVTTQAKHNPGVHFIGCEVFANGIAACLGHIEKHKLTNVQLFTEDARLLLERLPEHSIDRVFILFPDPWPKKKHHKRRIINPDTLALLKRVMKPGARLRMATDDTEYAIWMQVAMQRAAADFPWQAKRSADWLNVPKDHVTTRYETKARKAGRVPVFLDFLRA